MELSSAVSSFFDDQCADAYTAQLLFKGGISLGADSMRDSEVTERRILSTDGFAVLPPRRTVDVLGDKYIIGHSEKDTFRGKITRVNWVIQEATELANVYTLAQACSNAAGLQAWAGRVWIKDIANTAENSELSNQVYLQFSSTEAVLDDCLVYFGGRYNLVRTSIVNAAGMLMCLCEQMEEPVIDNGSIDTATFDPVTEASNPISTTVRVVRVRWQSLFKYNNNLAPKFGPDDIQLAIDKSVTPVSGAAVTLSDGKWVLQSVHDEHGVWLCRATRYA